MGNENFWPLEVILKSEGAPCQSGGFFRKEDSCSQENKGWGVSSKYTRKKMDLCFALEKQMP
jgi:hypothetical protein